MKPAMIFYKIRTQRSYLLKSYLQDLAAMALFAGVLLALGHQINLDLGPVAKGLLAVLGIINGLVVSSLLHNTSHGNIKNKVLNRLVGEYCGYWVLYGYRNFTMIHMLHHQHSDTELDPVNPGGMSFLVFLSAPMRYMIKRAQKFLFMTHGHHPDYQRIMQTQVAVFHFNLLLRALCWYLLLGPTLFTFFFLPAFFAIVFVFAHINYVCHRDDQGEIEIVNIDHNLYYKVVNFFTMGGYYHLNHHLNMKAFNPKYVSLRGREKELLQRESSVVELGDYFNLKGIWGHRNSRVGQLTTKTSTIHQT